MHFFISGKEFEQPENVRTYSRREFDTLFAFRYQDNSQQMLNVRRKELAYAVDTWEVVNQSANGFRLVRGVSGRKILHGQLLALCPDDSTQFILAQTVCLMQEQAGGLIAGIRALPGLPMATAVRLADQEEFADGKYHRAFLLPAVPAENSAQSLILPQGWYRNGRVLELFTGAAWRIRLQQFLDSGPDFDRVAFEIV